MEQGQFYLNLRGIPQQADFEAAIKHFERLAGRSVSVTSSDYFNVRAQTERGIPILLEGVTPVIGLSGSHFSHVGARRSHEKVSFNRISFPAAGMDALNTAEHSKYLHQACGTEPELGNAESERIAEDVFYAVLPGVEQRIFNGGTKTITKHPHHGELSTDQADCFTGSVSGGKFCLEKNDARILIDFHCPVGNSTAEEARAKFDGMLQAIAFLHGCNPWPDYFCHRRDHRVVERWLHPRSKLQSNPMKPLPYGDLKSCVSGTGEALFLAAASFFAKPSEEASRFSKALWLLRESCRADTPKEISVLTLCSVFEGLIKPHRGKKPCGKLKGEQLKQFRWVDPIESKLGISFETMEKALGYWDAYRNPLAHGFDEPSAVDRCEILDAYAYLFGAVYQVMASQIGFSDSIPQSLFGSKPVESQEQNEEPTNHE